MKFALQADGWIVRSVVCWRKPSPMPASLAGWRWCRCRVKVKPDEAPSGYRADRPDCEVNGAGVHYDHRRPPNAQRADCPGCERCRDNGGLVLRRGSWRPTSSWEPILMLAKQSGYYGDGIPVQTAPAAATMERDQYSRIIDNPDEQYAARHDHETVCDGGANLRDVWDIPAEPLSTHWCPRCMKFYDGAPPGRLCRRCKVKLESHYASFPTELVYRCLASSTSAKGYCPRCGAPWARVVSEATGGTIGKGDWKGGADGAVSGLCDTRVNPGVHYATYERGQTLGWRATCPHSDLPPRPAVVLDPFCGSARVGIQAQRMGLDFVGIELSPGYVALGRHLLGQAMPLFAEE